MGLEEFVIGRVVAAFVDTHFVFVYAAFVVLLSVLQFAHPSAVRAHGAFGW